MPTPDQIASAISAGVKAALAALPPEPAALPTLPTPKTAYTVRDAATQTGMCERTIWNLIRRGEIVSIKPAGVHRRLIRHDDLAAFLARQQPVVPGTAD